MANFPIPPHEIGDSHEEGGISWKWDGQKWVMQVPTITTGDVTLFDPANPASAIASVGTPASIPDVPVDTATQYDINRWFVDALNALDSGAVDIIDDPSFFSFIVQFIFDYTGTAPISVKTNAYEDDAGHNFLQPLLNLNSPILI